MILYLPSCVLENRKVYTRYILSVCEMLKTNWSHDILSICSKICELINKTVGKNFHINFNALYMQLWFLEIKAECFIRWSVSIY